MLDNLGLGNISEKAPARWTTPKQKNFGANSLDKGNTFLDVLDRQPELPKIAKVPELKPPTKPIEPRIISVPELAPQLSQKDLENLDMEITEAVTQQVHDDIMKDFLTEAATKLEITPEQWIHAMLEVEPAQLLEPTSKTIDKVISNLDVKGADIPKARELYIKLVEDLNQLETVSKSEDPSLALLAAAAMSQVPAEANKISEAQRIEYPLFAAPEVQAPQVSTQAAPVVAPKVVPKNVTFDSSKSVEIKSAAEVSEFEGSSNGKVSLDGFEPVKEIPIDELKIKELVSLKENVKSQRMATPEQVSAQVPVEDNLIAKEQMAVASTPMQKGESAQNQFEDKFLKGIRKSGEESAPSNIESDVEGKNLVENVLSRKSGQKSMEFGQGKKEAMTFGSEQPLEVTDSASASAEPEFFIDSMRQYENSRSVKDISGINGNNLDVFQNVKADANTQEIIRHAQIAVRQGGGEMSFQLNPENLGKVNMKMTVADGQVQLSFISESPEAKKIIEGGIGELRNSLATHNLSLDNVKVDVSQKSDNQMNNARSDGGDANREQAKSFMENFRDDRQSQRNNYIGDSEFRKQAMSETRASRTPGPKGSVYSARPNRGSLHLVA